MIRQVTIWDSVEGAKIIAEANDFFPKGEKHYETHKTSLKISNDLIERLKLDEDLLKKVVGISEEINKLNVE